MTSKHYSEDRQTREAHIAEIGYGSIVAEFVVDRGHKNGPEIHKISDTGIITIYNKRTNKLITKLIARPGQVRRYYKDGNAPEKLVKKALDNLKKYHYNY